MIGAFLAGAVAGYGVAIPVGPIAILILDTALRRGLRTGLAAGAGAATADGVYATIAGIGGAAVAGVIAPISVPLRMASVAVLVVIAARGLVVVRRAMQARAIPMGGSTGAVADPESAARHRATATYLRFLGLTIVNPSTVVYFAALVVGLPAVSGGAAERIVFAAGAFVASISWQSLLAVVGAVVHRRLPPSARLYTSLAGNLIVLALAANIARGLIP
ncbi:MAG TPA: LysE family transporter [Candidatus Limnocylindrales bacterium]